MQTSHRTKLSRRGNSSRHGSRRTVRWTHRECSMQSQRRLSPFSLARYKEFKEFQTRILVATNLFGRGMDIERVNIVFNYDMAESTDTYLHRVRPWLMVIESHDRDRGMILGCTCWSVRYQRFGHYIRCRWKWRGHSQRSPKTFRSTNYWNARWNRRSHLQ